MRTESTTAAWHFSSTHIFLSSICIWKRKWREKRRSSIISIHAYPLLLPQLQGGHTSLDCSSSSPSSFSGAYVAHSCAFNFLVNNDPTITNSDCVRQGLYNKLQINTEKRRKQSIDFQMKRLKGDKNRIKPICA